MDQGAAARAVRRADGAHRERADRPRAEVRRVMFTALSLRFRRQRMRRFLREFRITPRTRILDIGGTPDCWELIAERPRVTLLNTPRAKDDLHGAASWVAGDGRALRFREGAFDIVFSNPVIEPVGEPASQEPLARGFVRVGRSYWV